MTGRTTISTRAIKFAKQYPEPTFTVKKGRDWIEFGEDNLLPEYTSSLITKSADVQSIINGTIQYSIGNGFVPPTANPAAMALLKNNDSNRANPNDLSTITAKAIRDLVVHGAACIKVIWNKEQTAIAEVHHVSTASMRVDSEDHGYWICSDWKNAKKNVPEFIPSFSTDYGGTQLIYVKLPSAHAGKYAMPSFWACRTSIEIQHGLDKHFRNRTDNAFVPNAIIQFDDEPTEEEQDKIHKNFKVFNTGPDATNNGGIVEIFGTGVEIKTFTASEGPKDFQYYWSNASASIVSAFRVSGRGSIFGLARGGQTGTFGAREDILNEYELYKQTVIGPIQNTILRVWDMIAEINGAGEGFRYEIDPFVMFRDGDTKQLIAGEPTKTDVAATALNGAQIDSLVAIITNVSSGLISPAVAKPLLRAAFPSIPMEGINEMVAGASQANKPIDPII